MPLARAPGVMKKDESKAKKLIGSARLKPRTGDLSDSGKTRTGGTVTQMSEKNNKPK